MQNIEQQAIQTYQRNLAYLEKNHKALFDRINLLNSIIESGQYQEKFVLEYKDEGYFDVKEVESQEFLYKMNSIEHAKNINNLIDKKRSGAIFKGLKHSQANDAQAERIDKSELSFHNYLWASIKIINYVTKYAPSDSYMKKVYKIIFIGVGLGIHLQNIINKLQSKIIFIQEKNLELFRLSLFVTDYNKLSENKTLYFSILESAETEEKIFIDFLNNGNNYNLHMKHIPFDDTYTISLQQLQKYVLSQSFINYGYSPILLRYINSPKYLVQNYNFLDVSQRQTNDIFTDKPVLLLFSGPSTSNNIEWIKENHHRFIILSPLSTCKLLYKLDIKPDIVIHIDPGEKTSLLFNDIDTNTYFEGIKVILAANVNEDTINRFQKSQVHIIEQGSKNKKDFGILTAPSVGEYTYALSLIFDAREIYMLGIDLALDKETRKTHADFHFAQTQGQENNETASLDPESSIHYIKGNFSENIPTIAAYELSIQQLNYFSKYYKHNLQNIYNLSDGAYFEGTNPLHIDEYKWDNFVAIDKGSLSLSLDGFLKKIGSSEFRDVDRDILQYQLNEAKVLKRKILKHQKSKYTKTTIYFDAVVKLAWDLSDIEYKTNSDLAQVYYEYFRTINSYVFDLFNTQNLENEKSHIIGIKKILVQQLLKIANLYIMKLEEYLK